MSGYASYLLARRSRAAVFQCRVVVAVLVATLTAGCALRGGSTTVARPAGGDTVAATLDAYPLGTTVRLRLASGEVVSGALVSIDASAVTVEPAAGGPVREIARTAIVAATDAPSAAHRVGTVLLPMLGVAAIVFVVLLYRALKLEVDPCVGDPCER